MRTKIVVFRRRIPCPTVSVKDKFERVCSKGLVELKLFDGLESTRVRRDIVRGIVISTTRAIAIPVR